MTVKSQLAAYQFWNFVFSVDKAVFFSCSVLFAIIQFAGVLKSAQL